MTQNRFWVALGSLYGLIAVGMAAASAHLSDGRLPIARRVSATALASAVQMNGWHALALVACGVWGRGVFTTAAGVCFALGVLLFCGSIYAGFAGVAPSPVTPVGGGLLMLGWLALGLSALRR